MKNMLEGSGFPYNGSWYFKCIPNFALLMLPFLFNDVNKPCIAI